jgi:hypothetical protein
LRLETTTTAPASEKVRAMARPIPRLAPVIKATLPFNENSLSDIPLPPVADLLQA